MENEKRLIYANALMEKIEKSTASKAVKGVACVFVNAAPTVDAVEVVRCETCRDCEMGYPEKRLNQEATQAWLCKRYKRHVKPDDFCSHGERREGE